MNRTDTLLRLKRFRVDEMKRRISTIDAMRANLERQLTNLDEDVAREKQRANDSDIGRLAFPSFLRSVEARRENLRTTLKEIEREYESAQLDLNNAFQDLKALEFATEQQAKRLAEIEARRAQSRLDELALVRHLRKHTLRSARVRGW
jgi:flagellar protein FliJ